MKLTLMLLIDLPVLGIAETEETLSFFKELSLTPLEIDLEFDYRRLLLSSNLLIY